MPRYTDGFVIPIPKKNVAAYLRMARAASKIWKEYGALEYCECLADDLSTPCGVPFPKQLGLKRGETVFFSWVVWKSRKHRDAANTKIMADPRVAKLMQGKPPFDMTRMLFAGFEIAVDA